MKGDYEGNVPDTFVPLIGIRAWKTKYNNKNQLRLTSVYKDSFWPINRKIIAGCIEPFPNWICSPDGIWSLQQTTVHDLHAVPDDSCSCGIYAVKSADYAQNLTAWPDSTYTGLVFIWGKVLEGERGFRGQFARPAALLQEKGKLPIIKTLASIYNLPIINDLSVALQQQREAQSRFKPE